MKTWLGCVAIGSAFILSACAQNAGTMSNTKYTRIMDEATFNADVVDKQLTGDHGTYVIKDDGTFSGVFGGKTITGTWKWNNGYWCRTVDQNVGQKNDCQVYAVSGDKLRATRDEGKGKSYVFTIKG